MVSSKVQKQCRSEDLTGEPRLGLEALAQHDENTDERVQRQTPPPSRPA